VGKNGTQIQKTRSAVDRDLSHQMLGAAKYATVLHKQTASDLIRFLITVRDEKRYLDYDCQSFDEFLDSGHSPIPQRTFYRQLELFKLEGERYDLMQEWRIPAHVRKQLTDGDIQTDGTSVTFGDQRFELSDLDTTVARQLIERMVKERIEARKTIEKLEGYKGRYEKLQAEVDEAEEKPAYVIAFMNLIEALNVLVAEVKDLPGEMKGERGPADTEQIMVLMEQLFDAYGEAMPWKRGCWMRR
jgi:hypothetical protein